MEVFGKGSITRDMLIGWLGLMVMFGSAGFMVGVILGLIDRVRQ